MAKSFKNPSERLPVPDPDKIEVEFDHQVKTEGLRMVDDEPKGNPNYTKMFTQIRIERNLAERYKQLCQERGIKFYGNYINAVLKAYIEGELQNKE